MTKPHPIARITWAKPMRIIVFFQFDNDPEPAASTGVEGDVADVLLPAVGDLVRHVDFNGEIVVGRVKERMYLYDVPQGINVDGTVMITLILEKLSVV